ncbi:hypothetical protein U9M48_002415 [Paspalum notatum var. saurae]|uniref:Growth-regulating factor n=1 Tax=Paspalum notatum var. saurae TaxID=547442 RepID=A0AAQ3SJ18_PASNO
MQGLLSRVRGPFTPTQWMELEHQALIYKHLAVNAPVPSSLLLPIRRSLNPGSSLGSSSLGWAPFRSGSADVEPGRCRRTDGKKWRCSRDAVGDQKYCERHIKRGCHRSRKHVEGRKAAPTIPDPAMAVSGGSFLHSHNVAWQQQAKSSVANMTDPFSPGTKRQGLPCPHWQANLALLQKHGKTCQRTPRETFALVPNALFASGPGRARQKNLLDKQNMCDQFSVSTSRDSFDFSLSHSSPNGAKLAFSPLEMQHDPDQYLVHGAGSSAENINKSQDNQLRVSRETIDDGPLGEVFKGKSCQSASADILTDQWTAVCELHSPTGTLQMSSSDTVPIENHISSNSYLMARMVNFQTVPTLH